MSCAKNLRAIFAMSAASTTGRFVVAVAVVAFVLGFVTVTNAVEPKSDRLELNPANFGSHSYIIDNKWMPMKPGTRLTYDGFSNEDGDQVKHSVVTTYTDLTKLIAGVRVAIMLEDDYNDKKLEEREIAFHAQDKQGNVWHLGQLREMYEGPSFTGAQAWFIGQPTGAKAGIRMWANPQVGMVSSQGYAPPPFNWTDRGRVYEMGQSTKVAAGKFENVMIVDEWDEETPKGAVQTKFYAQGVGNVRVGFRGPDPEEEELELVRIDNLDANGMAKARSIVTGMEERAYIYSHTSPAEHHAEPVEHHAATSTGRR